MPRRYLTPADVRRLLAEHGLAPQRSRGQNFVVDPNTVRKVVRDARVVDGDVVVEVGPGLGSLTTALLDAGARVVAVEVDSGLVRALAGVLGDEPHVEVVHADALAVDYAALLDAAAARWALERAPLLVANLPYNIATPVVVRALEAGLFARLLVMVQKEVGERWVATVGDGDYSGVSVKIAALADARVAATVSRSAFHPVPNVDSVTVELVPRAWPHDVDRTALFRLVEAGFRQRRKRLRNALAGAATTPTAVEEALRGAGLDAGARAEELSLTQWVALGRVLLRGSTA